MTIDALSAFDFPRGKAAARGNAARMRSARCNRWLGALLCSTALVALPSGAWAVDWTGATNNDWNTGTNWTGNAVPTSTDDAVIGTSTAPTVSVSISGPAEADNLTLGNGGSGTLTVNDTTLTLNTGAGGDITLGNTSSTGMLMVTGSNGAVVADDITMGVAGHGQITVSDGASLTADLITLGNSGTGTGSLFINGSPGTVNATSISFNSSNVSRLVFVHTGTNYTFDTDLISGSSGNGEIYFNSGTTTLDGGASQLSGFSGDIVSSTGAIFVIGGSNAGAIAANIDGSFIWRSSGAAAILNGVISGGEALTLDSATVLTLNNAANGHGDVSILNGRLVQGVDGAFSSNVAYDLSGGVLDLNGFDLTADALTGTGGSVDLGAGTLTLAGSGNGTFAGAIGGIGSLVSSGSGTLTLSGINTFTGGTTVSGGTLLVNGSIGDVEVDGGVLGGSGTLGAVAVNAGGTLAPGNSIGTVSAGNTIFNSGSFYEVELNDAGNTAGTNNDLLDVTGTVTINGGTVNVTPENGTDDGTTYTPGTVYTIITSTGGVTGTFDAITDDYAFLNFALSYDASNVFATSSLADLCLSGFSANQCATADAIETLGSGTLFTAVTNLSTSDAPGAMDALSGEIHASGQAMLIEDNRFIRGTVNDRLRASFGKVAASETVRVASADGDLPLAPAGGSGVSVWGRAFGATGQRDANGNAAEMDRTLGGLLMGADTMVAEGLRLGVLAGYSHSSFDVDDRASSGSADGYHVGVYGGTQIGGVGLQFGGSYGWHEIDTSRSVVFPGFSDSLSANYNAQTAQLFGEAGYRIDAGDVHLEPFAGLSHVYVSTDGFTETGGAAALTVADSDTNTTFTTLGARVGTGIDLGQGGEAILTGTLGWRHAFGDVTPGATASFAGSSAFAIAGTPVDRNALVVGADADMALDGATTLGLSYSGEIGSDAQDHGLGVKLTVAF